MLHAVCVMALPPPTLPAPFDQSQFCWAPDLPPGRNQFVSFEQTFSCAHPEGTVLHLFADTRYRLWINGQFAAYGPGRFVTATPEYDSIDLTPWLRNGENHLRVEVNYYGSSSYQTMPDGMPGFIAAGQTPDGTVNFQTPGNWRVRIHRAWDAQAPHFSFAQNPAEICDTRVLENELTGEAPLAAQPLPASACPWQTLRPRQVPLPDYARMAPARLLVAGRLAPSRRWGLHVLHPEFLQGDRRSPARFTHFSTWIHSPRPQRLRLDCFWSDLSLNGDALVIEYPHQLGNHGVTEIELKAGWNFLAGNFELLGEHWSYLIGLPTDADVTLHALPDLNCPEVFAVSPPLPDRGVPRYVPDPEAWRLPDDWTLDNGDILRVTPARLVGWDSPARSTLVREIPWSIPLPAGTQMAQAAVWNFDFGDEYYGHPVLEIEAPAGSILDVAYDDWKREDGCVRIYGSNPFTDAADRFILKGGRQRIEVTNPRGGIYLQITLRTPPGSRSAPLRVHDVGIRRRTLLRQCEGSFTSGDPLLDWAWQVSIHTLQAAADEGYADCPWRERGSYIGDGLVNLHLHRLLSTDLRIARRTFDIFGQAQLPDGQLACCAPSWLRKPHEDFTLLWMLAVHDYWTMTGDIAFLQNQWPVIQRIWSSPTWKCGPDALWDTTGMRLFIDWGVLVSEREGPGNAVINVLRVAAARACATMARVLQLEDESTRFHQEAETITAQILQHLWLPQEGRLAASIGATTPALHANILALRFGIGPAAPILAYIEPLLKTNFSTGIEKSQYGGFAELYFMFYLLPALAENGRPDLAEEIIRQHYGFVQGLGYPTLPECFHRADQHKGSCCHSWSGAAAVYATAYVLGLRPTQPGNPDHWLLAPVVHQHRHAEGTLPHPRGLIRVRWERDNGTFRASAETPPGVTVTAGPGVIWEQT